MGWDGVSGVVVVARCWTGPCFRSQTELFRNLSRQPASAVQQGANERSGFRCCLQQQHHSKQNNKTDWLDAFHCPT